MFALVILGSTINSKPADCGGLFCLDDFHGIEPARVGQPCGLSDKEGEARRTQIREAKMPIPLCSTINQKPAEEGGLSCFNYNGVRLGKHAGEQ